MAAIYLKHPTHGAKVAMTPEEAKHDKEHGWKEFDVKEEMKAKDAEAIKAKAQAAGAAHSDVQQNPPVTSEDSKQAIGMLLAGGTPAEITQEKLDHPGKGNNVPAEQVAAGENAVPTNGRRRSRKPAVVEGEAAEGLQPTPGSEGDTSKQD